MAYERQETPPPPGRTGTRGRYDWDEIVKELKAASPQWLLIDDTATRGLATAIRRKSMAALKDPDWVFDVTTRNNNKEAQTAEVWMCAVPADQREET